jgi:thioredoxin reductase (NADPH)
MDSLVARESADAFPALSDSDLALLQAHGSRRPIHVGEYLFRQGDQTYEFYVVLSGAIDIVVRTDGVDHLITRHGPGRFVGELNLITGLRLFVSARVVEDGEVVVVSRQALHNLIATEPLLSDKILKALMARRAILLSTSAATESLRLVGSRFSPETRQTREYLTRSRIPHDWLDPDDDPSVDALLQDSGVSPTDLPVVITGDAVLRRVTAGSLAEYLGLTVANLPCRVFDLVVVGGGPAGLAAAVYGASEGLQTLVLEKVAVGGQAGTSSRIENYLGFPTGISGEDLTQRAMVQAEKFGAVLTSPCAAASLREEDGHLLLRLTDGTDVAGGAVIAATGAKYRRLDVDRLEDFEGNGVYYAATEAEARLCAGSPAVVVGGGNSAGQAALFLAECGSPVSILIRGSDLGKSMSRYLVDRIEAHDRIAVLLNSNVTGLDGDGVLNAVRVTGPQGEVVLPCAGLFSLIGADPSSDWLCGCAALDEDGFVLTDLSLDDEHLDAGWHTASRRPLPFETSRPGLFAVGDLRSGSMKRVAAAVGEGSAAVRSVHQYLAFDH